jgi:hypothetical protein
MSGIYEITIDVRCCGSCDGSHPALPAREFQRWGIFVREYQCPMSGLWIVESGSLTRGSRESAFLRE